MSIVLDKMCPGCGNHRLERQCTCVGPVETVTVYTESEVQRMIEAAQPKWIPVLERLPEQSGYILAVKGKNLPVIGMYYAETGELSCSGEGEFYILRNHLTHWMPLPEAPK